MIKYDSEDVIQRAEPCQDPIKISILPLAEFTRIRPEPIFNSQEYILIQHESLKSNFYHPADQSKKWRAKIAATVVGETTWAVVFSQAS